jgi:predicted phage-related endonuclease
MSLDAAEMRMVGGSDVAAICGVSPYAGPLSVWLRIVHGAQQPDNAYTSRGRRLEPVVLDWYREETGFTQWSVDTVRLRDPSRPHLRGSLDACVRAPGGVRPVEAKTANGEQARHWGDEGTDAIPVQYITQAQFYLGFGREVGAVEDDVCDVPALVAGDFRLYCVRYDADLYGELLERVERFWVDHVLTKKPPEDAPLPRDLEAVGWAFRRSDGKAVDFASLPPETQVTLEEYLRAYQEESAASDRRALWEARAKLALGSAPGVRGLPEALGFTSLSWKAQPGKTAWKRVAEALAKQTGVNPEQLSALAAENTGEGSRPFTPHKRRGMP